MRVSCAGGVGEPEQPLYTGASHPLRRRASVTETCLLFRIHGAYTLAVQLEVVSAEGWWVACNTAKSEMGLALYVTCAEQTPATVGTF